VKILRKVISGVPAKLATLEIVTTHSPDTRIVTIPLEKVRTKAEELRRGDTIVLEYDRLLNLLENPIEPGYYPIPQPEVLIRIVLLNHTGPVHTFETRARLSTQVSITLPIFTRAVCNKK
jgi:hypothetical protein